MPRPIIAIRGGGDLGSGVAIRLKRAGFPVIITDLAHPLCVRRLVCFSQAVTSEKMSVEGIQAELCTDVAQIDSILHSGAIPVLVDPDAQLLLEIHPLVWVDARMTKRPPETTIDVASLVLGLGPGFTAGLDCHAVIETNRGHRMGRVFWEGSTEPDTGLPESVKDFRVERVLYAPADGILHLHKQICDRIRLGEVLFDVDGVEVIAPFDGVLRGMLPEGQAVNAGLKVGDLDPRGDPSLCRLVSDKALAVGGGVLEAILTKPHIREALMCNPRE
jgi:xanthine dehydrogenase accessory factor